eukprot:TRINITY_DN635_c0_g1_i2.p1 TRINITY_DN635_c0_g1~~TRINITY_DN635_c0_g1_i2.p1  ORF type:complete len:2152 (-),score=235.56 TRINITY_DN635_c0_g1_i2:798-7253(-)
MASLSVDSSQSNNPNLIQAYKLRIVLNNNNSNLSSHIFDQEKEKISIHLDQHSLRIKDEIYPSHLFCKQTMVSTTLVVYYFKDFRSLKLEFEGPNDAKATSQVLHNRENLSSNRSSSRKSKMLKVPTNFAQEFNLRGFGDIYKGWKIKTCSNGRQSVLPFDFSDELNESDIISDSNLFTCTWLSDSVSEPNQFLFLGIRPPTLEEIEFSEPAGTEEKKYARQLNVLYFYESLYYSLKKQKSTSEYPNDNDNLFIYDVGEKSKELVDNYKHICNFQFLKMPTDAIKASYENLSKISSSSFSSWDDFEDAVDGTGWLRLVSNYVTVARNIVDTITKGFPTIIQTGSGDRYSASDTILISLVQIIIEPKYRTFEGFLAVFLKEWIGHSCLVDNFTVMDPALGLKSPWPTFFFFISCVYTLVHNYPSEFEFVIEYLVYFVDMVYEILQPILNEQDANLSIFISLLSDILPEYKNPFYKPNNRILIPNRQFYSVLFMEYILRHQEVHTTKLDKIRKKNFDKINNLHFPSRLAWIPVLPSSSKIQTISFQEGIISRINPDFLIKFQNLVKLDISQQRIRQIPPNFSLMSSLKYLNLSNNLIESEPVPYLSLPSLEKLYLDYNKLSKVGFIACFTKLETLSLKKNQITFLSQEFSSLVNLQSLCISENPLVRVDPTVFKVLTKITSLSLNNTQLQYVPQCFSQFSQTLKNFQVKSTFVWYLPKEFFSCKFITTLNLSDAKFSNISPDVGKLEGLLRLVIDNNNISTLPSELTNCHYLECLSASNNKLSEIPLWIHKFRKLDYINFSHNQIVKITSALSFMENLKKVDLSHNKIEKLPLLLGQLVSKLDQFQIEKNPIKNIPQEILGIPGTQALSQHLTQLSNESYSILRMKLLVYGQPSVGKTSLVNHLSSKSTLDDEDEEPAPTTIPFRAKSESYSSSSSSSSFLSNFSMVPPVVDEDISIKPVIFYVRNESKINATIGSIKASINNAVGSSVSANSSAATSSSSSSKTHNNSNASYSRRDKFTKALFVKKPMKLREKSGRFTVQLDIWDVGSHSNNIFSQNYFMSSSRSMYMYVFNISDPNSSIHMMSWAQSIHVQKTQGTKKKGETDTVVFIVGTFSDQISNKQRLVDSSQAMERELKSKYPSWIVQSIHVSNVLGGENISQLLSLIKSVFSQMPEEQRTTQHPMTYYFFESLLKEYRENLDVPVISFTDLNRIGQFCGLSKQDVRNCAKYLNDVGVILYFSNVPTLQDVVVLDVHWILKAMGCIFSSNVSNSTKTLFKNGIITSKELAESIWHHYPEDVHNKLIKLMEKFELCFQIKNNVENLIKVLNSSEMNQPSISLRKTTLLSNPNGRARSDNIMGLQRATTTSTPPPSVDDSKGPLVDSSNPSYLIPSLLSKNPPRLDDPSLLSNSKTHAFERIFEFNYMPLGLFSRIIARVLPSASKVMALWASGILMKSVFRSTSVIVYVTTQMNDLTVKVKCEDLELSRTSFTALIEIILSISDEWIQSSSLTRSAFYIYNLDIKERKFRISVDEVERMIFEEGKNHIMLDPDLTGVLPVKLPFDQFVPDIMVSSFSGLRINKNQITILDKLGEGAHASVHRGKLNDEVVAVKIIKMDDSKKNHKLISEFRTEVIINGSLNHPNLVSVRAICMSPPMMMISLCDRGDLYSYLHDYRQNIPWLIRLKIAKDIALGLKYLQDLPVPVAHLDLKSPNVLLHSTGPSDYELIAKIADFGTAKLVYIPIKVRYVENPIWLAPEVLSSLPYDHRSDTYSYGVILWEILTRDLPFGDVEFTSDIHDKIVSGQRPPIPVLCPQNYNNLIQKCWCQNQDDRPHVDDVIQGLDAIIDSLSEKEKNSIFPQKLGDAKESIQQLRQTQQSSANLMLSNPFETSFEEFDKFQETVLKKKLLESNMQNSVEQSRNKRKSMYSTYTSNKILVSEEPVKTEWTKSEVDRKSISKPSLLRSHSSRRSLSSREIPNPLGQPTFNHNKSSANLSPPTSPFNSSTPSKSPPTSESTPNITDLFRNWKILPSLSKKLAPLKISMRYKLKNVLHNECLYCHFELFLKEKYGNLVDYLYFFLDVHDYKQMIFIDTDIQREYLLTFLIRWSQMISNFLPTTANFDTTTDFEIDVYIKNQLESLDISTIESKLLGINERFSI